MGTRGTFLIHSLLSLCVLALTVECRAETTWIHAVGIDPNAHNYNGTSFYDEAGNFLDACRKSGLNDRQHCQLFLDTDQSHANTPDSVHMPPAGQTLGTAHSREVLAAFERALASAKYGDRIVLSLANHGSPDNSDSSCVYFGMQDRLCASEIAAILKHRPAGVQVMIAGEACFSGSFSELQSRDVCTFAESDKFRSGRNPYGLWSYINERMTPGRRLTLEDIRKSTFERGWGYTLRNNGGGFGSQVMRDQLCRGRASNETWRRVREAFSTPHQRADGQLDELQKHIETCSDYYDPTRQQFRDLRHFTSLFDAFSPETHQLAALRSTFCQTENSISRRLCSSLDVYERNLDIIENLKSQIHAKLTDLAATERRLSARDRTTRDEAERGRLLDQLQHERESVLGDIQRLARGPALREAASAIDGLGEELCLDENFVHITEPDHDERAHVDAANWSYTRTHLALTERSLQESLDCERNFSFP